MFIHRLAARRLAAAHAAVASRALCAAQAAPSAAARASPPPAAGPGPQIAADPERTSFASMLPSFVAGKLPRMGITAPTPVQARRCAPSAPRLPVGRACAAAPQPGNGTRLQAACIPALLRAEVDVLIQAVTGGGGCAEPGPVQPEASGSARRALCCGAGRCCGAEAARRFAAGSGKTLAYLLPMLARIDNRATNLQALILVPTRELAVQARALPRPGSASGFGAGAPRACLAGGGGARRVRGYRACPPGPKVAAIAEKLGQGGSGQRKENPVTVQVVFGFGKPGFPPP